MLWIQHHHIAVVMDESDDPYSILGVPSHASTAQIKAAYRKLALQHHPDRQADESSKHRAAQVFVKISNAYEIIGDEQRRQEYDRERQEEEDARNYRNSRRHQHQHHPFHFHDPMEVFAHVFGDEFGTQSRGRGGMDSFWSTPFGGGGMFGSHFGQRGGGGFFHDDPFFSDPFGRPMGGGGGMNGMFGMMQQQMDMMRQQQVQQRSGQGYNNSGYNNSGGFSSSFYSSSSSSNFTGGHRESVSTTTRIVNGKRQTITERVITKPDGTVERHVETDGDADFPPPQLEQSQETQKIEDGRRRRKRQQR